MTFSADDLRNLDKDYGRLLADSILILLKNIPLQEVDFIALTDIRFCISQKKGLRFKLEWPSTMRNTTKQKVSLRF